MLKLKDKVTKTELKQYVKNDTDIGKAINAYLNSQVGKFGIYFALPNALVARTLDLDYKAGRTEVCQSIIAMDINGVKIGNSSILPMLVWHYKSFGRLQTNSGIAPIQKMLGNVITMVPFTVFDESQLDIRKLNILEKLKDETIIVKIDNPELDHYADSGKMKGIPEFIEETRHFTGACLFEVEGKHFLFDIDRNEVSHKIFNPFLAEIPIAVKTVNDAYRALKPADVLIAEAQGLEVKRQGEWFFVPVKGEYEADKGTDKWDSDEHGNQRIELRAGDNRPNHATIGVQALGIVMGKVTHSGREHAPIFLKSWHKAIPNTAVKSFQISGMVD